MYDSSLETLESDNWNLALLLTTVAWEGEGRNWICRRKWSDGFHLLCVARGNALSFVCVSGSPISHPGEALAFMKKPQKNNDHAEMGNSITTHFVVGLSHVTTPRQVKITTHHSLEGNLWKIIWALVLRPQAGVVISAPKHFGGKCVNWVQLLLKAVICKSVCFQDLC